MGTAVNRDMRLGHGIQDGTPIKTPQQDYDKMSYWAGMAMRALLSQHAKPTTEEMREIASLSWQMADAMLDCWAMNYVR